MAFICDMHFSCSSSNSKTMEVSTLLNALTYDMIFRDCSTLRRATALVFKSYWFSVLSIVDKIALAISALTLCSYSWWFATICFSRLTQPILTMSFSD